MSVAVVGARGHVGRELVRILDAHPTLATAAAVSRELAGTLVADEYGADTGRLRFTPTLDEHLGEGFDVVVLALPNGHASAAVAAIEHAGAGGSLVIDLSADFRFDDAWAYAVPELHASALPGARRVSNPGCYATAMQLALAPVVRKLASAPACFGVSGYTGAGTTPSEKNDAAALAQGVLPYALAGHLHEREVGRRLGRPVRFAPCVAGYPRGITLTALLEFAEPVDTARLTSLYEEHYAGAPFVRFIGAEMPRVTSVIRTPDAIVGGLTVDERDPYRAAVVCVLDNLLKGAASQAVQNLNLALGLDPAAGLRR